MIRQAQEVDPREPVHLIPFSLNANELRDFHIPGTRVIYLLYSLAYGTANGDLSMALGETGSFVELVGGAGFVCSQVDRIRIRNNQGSIRNGMLAVSPDPNFRVLQTDWGV